MNSRLPPLNSLRVFECAVRHMSFTDAAQELNISQSAVSHQIRTLEDWLNFQLFARNASRLTLTPSGKMYGDVLSSCFGRIGVATDELVASGPHQILHLRGYTMFMVQWLIPRLSDFQAANPDIKLRLASAVEPVDFRRESVDMGIIYGDGGWSGLRSDLVFSDELLPLMSPRLAERVGQPCTLEQLFTLPFLHSRLRDQWDDWLQAVGGKRPTAAHDVFVEDVSILYRFALEGLGVALTQRRYAQADLDDGRVVAPHDFILRRSRGYHLVCPAERAEDDKVRRFRQWLLAGAAEPA